MIKKIVYIMRGVPGSGKSTRARELAGRHGRIHSTDSYFYRDGKFCFDRKFRSECHERNFLAFCQSLADGIHVVICDNVNSSHWDYKHYMKIARMRGYEVRIVQIPHPDPAVAAARNIHEVPKEVIERMISEWEPSNIPTKLCTA